MTENELLRHIEILPESQLFSQRENDTVHTPYKIEIMFYSCIKNGSSSGVKIMFSKLLENKVVVGKLSENPLRQIQYLAVSAITLATRYAIQGGLDETTAFNFSDNCIMDIDKMTEIEKILALLYKKSLELANMVAESRENIVYPPSIRSCLHYIHTHLHEELNLNVLASQCNLSQDYLSRLFKKSTGSTPTEYIKNEKLNAAKQLLGENYSISEIAYYLGFCSESYFIKCFKDKFGKTPKQYKNTN